MNYFGIDASGKYSKIVAINENHRILGRHSGASADLRRQPATAVAHNVTLLVKEQLSLINASVKDFDGVCFAADPSVVQSNAPAVAKMFKNMGFDCEVKTVCVQRALMAGKTGPGHGMLLYAGNDVSGYILRRDGSEIHTGGYGYYVETGGSAYALGAEALRQVVASYDGRAEQTALTDLLKRHLGAKNVPDILTAIQASEEPFTRITELSGHIRNAASSGDEAAIGIEKRAADALASFAASLIERAGGADAGPLVLGGPVLLLNESLERQVSALLRIRFSGSQILTADEKAEYGAALLALGK